MTRVKRIFYFFLSTFLYVTIFGGCLIEYICYKIQCFVPYIQGKQQLSQYRIMPNIFSLLRRFFYSETAQVVDPVNTLQEKLQTNSKFREDIVDTVQRKYGSTSSQRKDLIAQEREK